MAIQFDAVGNLRAQIRAGALASFEALTNFIARIETSDDTINVVAVSDFKELP